MPSNVNSNLATPSFTDQLRAHQERSPVPGAIPVARFVEKHDDAMDRNDDGKVTHQELINFAKTHRTIVEQARLPKGVDVTQLIHKDKGFSWVDVTEISGSKDSRGPNPTWQVKGITLSARPPYQAGGSHRIDLENGGMKKWAEEIMTAARLSRMKPEILAAQIWAESRGNPNEEGQNVDGSKDIGLMQISNQRFDRYILPTLSGDERASIKRATGKNAGDLDMRRPAHNVIGGAFELRYWLDKADGNLKKALNGYVSGNLNGKGPGDDNYAKKVLYYANQIRNGKPMTDDDSKLPGSVRAFVEAMQIAIQEGVPL